MHNNPSTDHETPPLDAEDWQIAFKPYANFPDLAFILAQHLYSANKLVEQGQAAEAMAGIDRAIALLSGAHTGADELDGRYDSGVSQPEIQRQVRQQRADIDALYELVERVDQKVDAVDVKLDRRFDEISVQLSEVLRQLRGR